MKKPLIVLYLVVILLVFSCNVQKRVITVTGHGEVLIVPDFASITFSIETLNFDAEKSQMENTKNTQAVFALLKEKYQIPENEVQTIDYKFDKSYNYENNRQVFKGYRTLNTIQIKLKLMGQYKDLLLDLIKMGTTGVSSIEFGYSDIKEIEKKAIELAVADAKNKASIIASKEKLTIVKAIKIDEITSNGFVNNREDNLSESYESKKSFTNIVKPGEKTISVTIYIEYQCR